MIKKKLKHIFLWKRWKGKRPLDIPVRSLDECWMDLRHAKCKAWKKTDTFTNFILQHYTPTVFATGVTA